MWLHPLASCILSFHAMWLNRTLVGVLSNFCVGAQLPLKTRQSRHHARPSCTGQSMIAGQHSRRVRTAASRLNVSTVPTVARLSVIRARGRSLPAVVAASKAYHNGSHSWCFAIFVVCILNISCCYASGGYLDHLMAHQRRSCSNSAPIRKLHTATSCHGMASACKL